MALYKTLKPDEVLKMETGHGTINIKLATDPANGRQHGTCRVNQQPALLVIDAPREILISSVAEKGIWIGDPKE